MIVLKIAPDEQPGVVVVVVVVEVVVGVYVVVPPCAVTRALRVIGPILPSATRPCDAWNAWMVWIVFLPNTPSTVRLGDGVITVFKTVWMFFRSSRVSICEGKEMKALEEEGKR